MLRVLVLYPKGDNTTFNADYWTSSHMALVAKNWPSLVKWEADLGTPDSPYYAAAHLYFDNEADLKSSMESPAGAEVLSDIPNYTNVEPIVSVNVVAATS